VQPWLVLTVGRDLGGVLVDLRGSVEPGVK